MSNKPRGIFEDLAPHVTLLRLVLQLLEAGSQAQNSYLFTRLSDKRWGET